MRRGYDLFVPVSGDAYHIRESLLSRPPRLHHICARIALVRTTVFPAMRSFGGKYPALAIVSPVTFGTDRAVAHWLKKGPNNV